MMPKEWKTYKLGEIADYINRGVTPSYSEKGLLVINQKCVRDGKVSLDLCRSTNSDKMLNREKLLVSYDILINSTGQGTLGRVGLVGEIQRPITVDSHVTIVRINKAFNPVFVGYVLKAKQSFIENLAEGSTGQTELSRNKVADIDIILPPLSTQTALASILSSLDEKIELNLQMNKTLESIAKAIFKEWFVGEKNTSLSQYVDFNPKVSIPKGMLTKYVEMSDLPVSGFSIRTAVSRNYSNGSKFENNDTLLARITPCLENGKTGFVDFLETNEFACGSTEFIVMRAKEKISPYYVYLVARDNNFREFAIKSMVGTSGRQRVQTDLLRSFLIPSIDLTKMDEFNNIVTPLFNRIKLNSDVIFSLSSIRDLLIPNLIAGKIRVE